jgi:prepilin-type N-terminal cleavage/methylation domain-containing protein
MSRIQSPRGFSLVELLAVVSLFAILSALAIPAIGVGNRVRVNNAASEVRGVLQTARLRSVAVNRPLQVRFNCPATGQYRIVEAGAMWGDSGRCDPATYKFPAPADAAYRTPPLPRYDGPVQMVNSRVALSGDDPTLVLEFSPDGRVRKVVGGAAQMIASIGITVSSDGYQKTISVNGLGKVLAQ